MSAPKCEHGRTKYLCVQCGGPQICEHKKERNKCIVCEGSSICHHAKRRARCVECGGASMCEHKKRRAHCAECGGREVCPNCITWIDPHMGSKRYDGHCARCFKRLFPDDPRSKIVYEHTKEIRVRNTINENFEGFIHDKPIYTGNCDCTHRRRVDHRKLIEGTLLCIETDEFAHSRYDKKDEELRYDDLYMVYSGKWIFIRFNPDGKGVDMEDKLTELVRMIQIQIERIEAGANTEPVEIIKLFY